mgnify:CR=1 FL=1
MNPILRKKLIEDLVKELNGSSYRTGDADWHMGFKPSAETPVEESEYDPKTGKVVNNTTVGDHATFLQQWDADGSFFLEDDIPDRDSGTYSFRLQNK